MTQETYINYVGALQEYCTWKKYSMPVYEDWAEGPSHCRCFSTRCTVSNIQETMTGKTKKLSKNNVAKAMILRLKKINAEISSDQTDIPVEDMNNYSSNGLDKNYVGALLEYCVKNNHSMPTFKNFIGTNSGYNQCFVTECRVSNVEERGYASTKKAAKHASARAVLAKFQGTTVEKEDIKYDPSKVPDKEPPSTRAVRGKLQGTTVEEEDFKYDPTEVPPGISKVEDTPSGSRSNALFSDPLFVLNKYCQGCSIRPQFELIQKPTEGNPKFIFKVTVDDRMAHGSGKTEMEAKNNGAAFLLQILIRVGKTTFPFLKLLQERSPDWERPRVIIQDPVYVLNRFCSFNHITPNFHLIEKPSGLTLTFKFRVVIGSETVIGSGSTAAEAKRSCSQCMINLLINRNRVTIETIKLWQSQKRNAAHHYRAREASESDENSPISLLRDYCRPRYELIKNPTAMAPKFEFKVTVGDFSASSFGNSKLEAKKNAAQAMLDTFKSLKK